MKFFKIILLLGMTFSFALASADEGFSTDIKSLPSAVLKTWNATFAIAVLGNGLIGEGSSFLVATEGTGMAKVFYFVTNAHVIGSACKIGEKCAALIARNFVSKDNLTNEPIEAKNLNTFSPSLIKIDIEDDLALLEATFDGDGDISDLLPVEFPKDSHEGPLENAYAFGFPLTNMRSKGIAIKDANLIQRRWSHGEVGSYQPYNKTIAMTSNIDIMHGNSGGPVVNEDGKVIGVTFATMTNDNNEDMGQSFHIPLFVLKSFLQKTPAEF